MSANAMASCGITATPDIQFLSVNGTGLVRPASRLRYNRPAKPLAQGDELANDNEKLRHRAVSLLK